MPHAASKTGDAKSTSSRQWSSTALVGQLERFEVWKLLSASTFIADPQDSGILRYISGSTILNPNLVIFSVTAEEWENEYLNCLVNKNNGTRKSLQ